MGLDPEDAQGLSRDGTGLVVMQLRDINIDENSILRIQGYRDLEKIRPAIRRAAVSAARETETLIDPKIFYRIVDVQKCEGAVLEIQNDLVFENEAFQRLLKGPKQVAIFILTMGHALDKAVIDYMAGDQLLMALFLETAGWLGIEAATRKLKLHLREECGKIGCRLSPRLGPGYSYKLDGRSVFWPLEQQQTLFKFFANDTIGVELLESCAMMPKISRSGLFGFLTT